MKTFLHIILVLCISAGGGFAADQPVIVRLGLREVALEDALTFYSRLTKRKIWVALGVRATVSIQNDRDIPLPEALAFIRATLLERHGIELRDSEAGETFVTWSNDPQYMHLATPSTKPFGHNPKLPEPK